MFPKPDHLAGPGLSAIASAAWDRIVAECQAAALDIAGKFDVVERFAVTYALWYECQLKVRTEGQTVEVMVGAGEAARLQRVRNPRMIDLHRLNASLKQIRSELGLSPLKQSDPAEPGGPTTGGDAGSEAAGPPLIYKIRERDKTG